MRYARQSVSLERQLTTPLERRLCRQMRQRITAAVSVESDDLLPVFASELLRQWVNRLNHLFLDGGGLPILVTQQFAIAS